MPGGAAVSQEDTLALVRVFGPLTATEIAKTGMMNRSTASHALSQLKRWGDTWNMEGWGRQGGRLCVWGAV